MTFLVRTAAGESAELNDAPLAHGAETAIHTLKGFPGVVVKMCHPQILQERGITLREKIEAMGNDPVFSLFKQIPGLAWPRFSLYDEQKRWRGYAMRKAGAMRMTVVAHAMAHREHFPEFDRPILMWCLLSIRHTIDTAAERSTSVPRCFVTSPLSIIRSSNKI